MADISMIGAGSWGIALAVLLYKNGHRVTVWSAIEAEIRMLQKEHEYKDKLPGVKLPEDMEFTTDLEQAVKGADVLVLAVPSPYTRSTSHNMASYVEEGQLIVNVAKGIEEKTLLTLSQIIEFIHICHEFLKIIHFIDRQNNRFPGTAQHICHLGIRVHHSLSDVHQEDDNICRIDGDLRLFPHLRQNDILAFRLDTACINQCEIHI